MRILPTANRDGLRRTRRSREESPFPVAWAVAEPDPLGRIGSASREASVAGTDAPGNRPTVLHSKGKSGHYLRHAKVGGLVDVTLARANTSWPLGKWLIAVGPYARARPAMPHKFIIDKQRLTSNPGISEETLRQLRCCCWTGRGYPHRNRDRQLRHRSGVRLAEGALLALTRFLAA